MASTYTPLGVELQATGENAGTWGTKTNTNLQIIEQISGGYTTQAVSDSGDTTLSVSDGSTGATLSHRVIEFTGSLTASRNVTIPLDVQNFYFLKNATSGSQNVVFKYVTGTGTSATVANGKTVIAYAKADDGTNPNISTISLASDLVDDTTPQLGGNLDTNSFMIDFDDAHGIRDENGNEQLIFETTGSAVNHVDITNAATGSGPEIGAVGDDSNINLELRPKGTGEIMIGTGAATATLTSSGAYDLTLDTNNGTNSGTITITDGANGNITSTPNGTGYVEVGGNTNPGTLQLNCENNSHGIKLQSPAHSASQSYTLKFPTGNVTAGTFLKVNSITGSGTTAVGQLSFAAAGTSWQSVQTSTFTAAAGEGYFVNTTSGVITMNLPAGTLGDEIAFIDYAGTFDSNTFTVSANGSEKIHGSTDDLTISTERAANTLVFTDSTQGWLLKNN